MISKNHIAIVVLSAVSGFGGGILSVKSQVVDAASQQTIRATRFELVDSSDKSIAFWGTDQVGQLVIAFTKGTQSELAAFGLFSGVRGGLSFNGIDTSPRVALVIGDHGKPGLSLYDDKGRGRVGLGFITADSLDPDPDTWGLVLSAPPGESGHRVRAAIGYSRNLSTHGWDGSILLEDNAGKTWKAP
jgi:hypothetical protein